MTSRAAIVLATALAFAWPGLADACARAPQPQLKTSPLTIETLRGTHRFDVELAVKPEEKRCGLMRRPRLTRDAGMLFRNDPPGPSFFWMKNTPQPLDMLFIDGAGRVVHVAEHTTPYSTGAYGTEETVAAILELRAGSAARMALELGDRVDHPWFRQD